MNGCEWSQKKAEGAQRAIGYTFRNGELLRTCFTHKSYANLHGGKDNERLEFLGDAVIQLYVTEVLFEGSSADEGALTERRQKIVSQSALTEAEKRAGLMRFLCYSGKEANVRGKTASNLFEAVAAGIYLDGGYEEASRFLRRFLVQTDGENYKTLLQEFVQEREHCTPEYETRADGCGFVSAVSALGQSAEGSGESKKTAETNAAKALYQILQERAVD